MKQRHSSISPTGTYSQRLAQYMQKSYDTQAPQYRCHDEIHIGGPDHQRVCSRLKELCRILDSPLHVLDLGCGTGRHFHCLRNVTSLMAVDVSPMMLEQAKTPIRANEVDISPINYVCGDFYSLDYPQNHFALIYSFGVFGNGCHLPVSLAKVLFDALAPGGCFFFDSLDPSSLPFWSRLRHRLRGHLYFALPDEWQ